MTQQVGPVISKIVVAVALTNVLACILANILVATRLTYSMARDNMLPFSHVWRHVSPSNRTPTYAVLGIFGFSTILLLSALVSREGVLPHPGALLAGGLRDVPAADGGRGDRQPPRDHPGPEPGTFDLGRARVPVAVLAMVCFTLVCAALIFLPQFAGNGYVFLGLIVLAGIWAVTGLRKRLATGEAGPDYAKTHASS